MMVLLPDHRKSKKNKVLKHCKEPGCGKEYLGLPITKYCEFHRVVGNRARKVVVLTPLDQDNFILEHNFTRTTVLRRACDCCGAEYTITVIPKQQIYSKYCEDHTNSYKRELYAKAKN